MGQNLHKRNQIWLNICLAIALFVCGFVTIMNAHSYFFDNENVGGSFAIDAPYVYNENQDKYFGSFTSAYNAADDGDTLRLLASFTENVKHNIELNQSKEITLVGDYTLNLAGYNINLSSGKLNLNGSTITGENSSTIIVSGGELNLLAGKIGNTALGAPHTVTLDGGKLFINNADIDLTEKSVLISQYADGQAIVVGDFNLTNNILVDIDSIESLKQVAQFNSNIQAVNNYSKFGLINAEFAVGIDNTDLIAVKRYNLNINASQFAPVTVHRTRSIVPNADMSHFPDEDLTEGIGVLYYGDSIIISFELQPYCQLQSFSVVHGETTINPETDLYEIGSVNGSVTVTTAAVPEMINIRIEAGANGTTTYKVGSDELQSLTEGAFVELEINYGTALVVYGKSNQFYYPAFSVFDHDGVTPKDLNGVITNAGLGVLTSTPAEFNIANLTTGGVIKTAFTRANIWVSTDSLDASGEGVAFSTMQLSDAVSYSLSNSMPNVTALSNVSTTENIAISSGTVNFKGAYIVNFSEFTFSMTGGTIRLNNITFSSLLDDTTFMQISSDSKIIVNAGAIIAQSTAPLIILGGTSLLNITSGTITNEGNAISVTQNAVLYLNSISINSNAFAITAANNNVYFTNNVSLNGAVDIYLSTDKYINLNSGMIISQTYTVELQTSSNMPYIAYCLGSYKLDYYNNFNIVNSVNTYVMGIYDEYIVALKCFEMSTYKDPRTELTISRTSSYRPESAGILTESDSLFYGDALSITCAALSSYTLIRFDITHDGSTDSTLTSPKGITSVKTNVEIVAESEGESFTLFYPAMPANCAGYYINLNGARIVTDPTVSSWRMVYITDVLEIYAIGVTGYVATAYFSQNSQSTITVNSNVDAVIDVEMSKYTVNYPAKPVGCASYYITVNEIVVVADPASGGSFLMPYFDTLEVFADAAEGYNVYKSYTIDGLVITVIVEATLKTYVLTYPAMPQGCSIYTIKVNGITRINSPTTTGVYSIKHNDELIISATASTGYMVSAYFTPGNLSTMNAASDIIAVVDSEPDMFNLTYPAMPAGISSYTITRNGEALVSDPETSGSVPIYYDDNLVISATPVIGFNAFYYFIENESQTIKVTDNVSAYVFASIKTFVVIYPAKPLGCDSYYIKVNGETSVASPSEGGSINIIYGDSLEIFAAAGSGYIVEYYFNPGEVSIIESAADNYTATIVVSTIAYTLSYPARPSGCTSYIITKNGSEIVSSPPAAGSISVREGDVLVISAVAASGYSVIAKFTQNDSDTITVNSNVDAVVTVSQVYLDLQYPAKPAHCTYSIYLNGTVIVQNPPSSGVESIRYGSTVRIEAVADPGYTVNAYLSPYSAVEVTFTQTGTAVVSVSAISYTLTYPARPTGCSSYTITLNGTVIVNGSFQSGTYPIYYDDTLTISASASTGYTVSAYFTPGSSSSISVTRSVTAVVNTYEHTYNLSYPAMPEGCSSYSITRNGSTIVSSPTSGGSRTLYYGDSLSITATAATGYNVVYYLGSAGTTSISFVSSNVSASVTAALKIYTLSYPSTPVGCNLYKIYKNGTAIINSPSSSGSAEISHGDTLQLEVSASEGYTISGFLTGGSTSVLVTRDITAYVSTTAKSYRLTYPAMPSHCLSYTVRSNREGIIVSSPSSSDYCYVRYGDYLTLTATAESGWLVNYYFNAGGEAVTVTGDTDITIITALDVITYTLSYPAKPVGCLSYTIKSGGTTIIENPTSSGTFTVGWLNNLTISATAQTGYNVNYYFNNGSTSITVTDNVSASVNASRITYSLSYPAKPTGCASYTIYRNNTTFITGGSSSGSRTIYYDDELEITATPSSGYTVSASLSSYFVQGDVTAYVSATPTQTSFTLSYPATPVQSSYTIWKNGSTIVSSPSSSGTASIKTGDSLDIGGNTWRSGWILYCSLSQYKVTGNVTATVRVQRDDGPILESLPYASVSNIANEINSSFLRLPEVMTSFENLNVNTNGGVISLFKVLADFKLHFITPERRY